MDRLLKIGFINVGHWKPNNDKIKYYLALHNLEKNVLYCFVTNGEIKYIGKTTMTLSKRMYGYQNPNTSQTTNFRVNLLIKETLENNEPIDIFILTDNGLLKYGDFKINLSAGLEDTLIYEINPIWNFSGKNKLEEDKNSNLEIATGIDPSNLTEKTSSISFNIELGKTYYNQGFFNVKVEFSELLGADKEIIEIQLGDESENIIKGYINRTANDNGTPRIMGGKTLTYWIKKNFKLGEIMNVEILSSVAIKITKKPKA
ncbi:GIY-YIG nuclease family protein [Flavobacterium limnophilum]|uniref:GIY-YIG nuclease family protein n=1 Tax=Flavobacterium limnophilum TaxID=3003262 RepID=UPI0022AC36DC|nr:GIY-YIG nuclease family protein [Flavobacterium limnophilum]